MNEIWEADGDGSSISSASDDVGVKITSEPEESDPAVELECVAAVWNDASLSLPVSISLSRRPFLAGFAGLTLCDEQLAPPSALLDVSL